MLALALVFSGLGCAKTQPCALATSRTDSQQAGSLLSAGPCCFVAEQHQALYTPAALPMLQSEEPPGLLSHAPGQASPALHVHVQDSIEEQDSES